MIAEIQARILEAAGNPFFIVEGAVSLAQIKDRPTALPACFVFPVRDASSENSRATGGILQKTEHDIGVLIIFENLSSPVGDAAADDLETLFGWVRACLLGFVPTENMDPIEHVSGELIKARSGTIWWQETFGTADYLEAS